MTQQNEQTPPSPLVGPPIDPAFERELNQLVSLARRGHLPSSSFFNPSNEWLVNQMPILQDIPASHRDRVLREAQEINREAEEYNAAGRAAPRAGPEVVIRLDTGGLAFFSQLGVARRPDITKYFIDGFARNRIRARRSLISSASKNPSPL